MAGLCIGKVTDTSIQVYLSLDKKWTDANGDRDYKWFRGKANGGIPTESSYTACSKWMVLENGVDYGGYYTFKNLEPSTTYGFYCPIYKSGTDTLLGYASGYATTNEARSWILNTSNFGEFDLTWTPTYDGYYTLSAGSMFRIEMTFADNGVVKLYTTGSTDTIGYFGTSSGFDEYDSSGEPYSYDYSNDDYTDHNFYIEAPVTVDTTYYLWVRALSPTKALETTVYVELEPPKPAISKWDWTASNGENASANVTLNSYYALNKDTHTSDFSHLVWMDMVDKVWEVIQSKTNWWDSDYADKNTTKNLPQNSDGLYELTAVAFNSLRNNIELIGNRSDVLGKKTGIGQVFAQNANYPVKAEYFLTLADYINDCIDNL